MGSGTDAGAAAIGVAAPTALMTADLMTADLTADMSAEPVLDGPGTAQPSVLRGRGAGQGVAVRSGPPIQGQSVREPARLYPPGWALGGAGRLVPRGGRLLGGAAAAPGPAVTGPAVPGLLAALGARLSALIRRDRVDRNEGTGWPETFPGSWPDAEALPMTHRLALDRPDSGGDGWTRLYTPDRVEIARTAWGAALRLGAPDDRRPDRLDDWLDDRLDDWLADWLADWPADTPPQDGADSAGADVFVFAPSPRRAPAQRFVPELPEALRRPPLQLETPADARRQRRSAA